MDCSSTQPKELRQGLRRHGHLTSPAFRYRAEQGCCCAPTLVLPGWAMAIRTMDLRLPSSDGLESLAVSLFGPQSFYRLNRAGAVRGNGRCAEGEQENRKRRQHNDDWIKRIDCKQQRT
jgi:hypothetical protein